MGAPDRPTTPWVPRRDTSRPETPSVVCNAGGAMRILVVNAGSSSLKLTLLACADGGDGPGADTTIATRELDAPLARVDPAELRKALDSGLGDADAVGHRIVHGGERFGEAVAIDAEVERELRA